MKKTLSLAAFLILSTTVNGQQNSSKDKEAVKQLIIDIFDDIWSDFKSKKITEHQTKDFLLLEQGEIWNNDSIKSYHQRKIIENSQAVRTNEFDFFRIEQSDKNTIWVAYHNYGTWSLNEKIIRKSQYLESGIAIKIKGKWKLQQLQSTRVKHELF